MRCSALTVALTLTCLSPVAVGDLGYEVFEVPSPPDETSPVAVQWGMAEGNLSFVGVGDPVDRGTPYYDSVRKLWRWQGGWTQFDLSGDGDWIARKHIRGCSATGYVAGEYGGYNKAMGWHVTAGSATARQLPVSTTEYSGAVAVNVHGLMTGYTDKSEHRRAFAYDWQTNSATLIPHLDFDGDGVAHLMVGRAVNNHGVVAGIVSDDGRHAFVWSEADGVSDLLPEGGTDDIYDINDTGYVALSYNGSVHLKQIGGELINTHLYSGGGSVGINDGGWVVGSAAAYSNQPALYRDGELDPIEDLLVGGGAGYDQIYVKDINQRGEILAAAQPSGSSGHYVNLLLLPVTGQNVVANTSFDDATGLNFGGGGSGEVVTDPADASNSCVEMTTGSPVYVEQTVDTPNGSFEIAFDYRFLDAGGTLDVHINDELLESLGPAVAADPDWVSHGFLVTDEALYDLPGATLKVTLDHPGSGQRVLLDNLELRVVDEIPEPATLALLAGAAWVPLVRRKRR